MNILDSSVFLAHFYKEKGGDTLRKLFKQCQANKETIFVHQINFMEVIYKIKSKFPGYDLTDILAEFSSPWWGKLNYMGSDLMILSAEFKSKFPHASLADCIGLSATKISKGTFWTADKLLADIGKSEKITVKLIR